MLQKMNLAGIKAVLAWTCLALCCLLQLSNAFASVSLEGIQVYAKNSTTPEKKEHSHEDLFHYRGNNNLWEILRSEFALSHYEKNPAVQENIDWFMDNQDFLLRTASRAAPYLYFIHEQVKKRKLPVELVLVPIIESGYNPFTLSTAGAAGIWQMMPGTASGFGVKQDWWYDGRRDIVASTKAALDYLSYLFEFFDGNPLLALAAYNSGEGTVMSAIRRNIREGESTDFWSLPLPRETRTYVPRLLALASIIAHPESYPVHFPAVRNTPYLAQVDVGGQIDLKRAATFAGMSLKEFQHLNPGYNRLVTHPNGPYKLVLPIENVERFMTHLARTSVSSHIDWVQYKVKSRDSLETVAKHFNTTSNVLAEINHLNNHHLKKGMRLVIPRTITTVSNTPQNDLEAPLNDRDDRVSIASRSRTAEPKAAPKIEETLIAENVSSQSAMQSGDTLYMVRPRDTVEKIAERYDLPAKLVYAVNHLHSDSIIHPGEQILVPTHLAQVKKPKEEEGMRNLSPGDTLYMVRSGDTIEKIAQRFQTTPSAIRVANLMADNRLQEGGHIIVPTHLRKGGSEGPSLPLRIQA